MGATVTEALTAADRLEHNEIPVDAVCVTSPGLMFEAIQARCGLG
jgi:pyruvate dehydrogenase E1 component